MVKRKTLSWIIAAEIVIFFAAVLGLAVARKEVRRRELTRAAAAWDTVAGRSKVAREFVWTADVQHSLLEGQKFRFRLAGQTRMLEVTGDLLHVSVREITGREDRQLIAESRWPSVVRAGNAMRIVKDLDYLTVFLDAKRVLLAPCSIENWRDAVWEVSGMAAPFAVFSYQKVGSLIFADDFMHDKGELGAWKPTAGTWKIDAMQNPIRSANPFAFLAQGEDATALAGNWFWRNYDYACTVRPLPESAFGMVFCRYDEEHSYQLKWVPTTPISGRLSLVKIAAGRQVVLAEKQQALPRHAWTRLRVSQLEGLLTAHVDGLQAFQVTDPDPLPAGLIGLWSSGGEGTVFDDVEVTPVSALECRFTAPLVLPPVLRAPREITDAHLTESGLVLGRAGGVLALGGVTRENVSLQAQLAGLGALETTLELRTRENGGDFVGFRISGHGSDMSAELFVRWEGNDIWVDRQPVQQLPAEAEISLHTRAEEAWGCIDDRIVCLAAGLPVVAKGTCSLRVSPENNGITLTSLALRPARPLPSIENRVETFTYEDSMRKWSSPIHEWTASRAGGHKVYWHRSDFWQDLAAWVDMRSLAEEDLGSGWGLILGTGKSQEDPGIRAGIRRAEEQLELQLVLAPEKVHRLVLDKMPDGFGIEKRNDRLLVRLDERIIWNQSLPETLQELCRVGRFGQGADEKWAQAVRIRAGGVKTYSFKHAPADWCAVAGTWQVTNRWQCDPRWSFFSGVRPSGVACNWNKRRHGTNVSVEFFAGPKMDRSRGDKYQYAADINAVICGGGRDIVDGYSFMFGGWNDKGSYILRGTQVLSENTSVIIPRAGSTHRRWFHVKLRKHNDTLALWVDGVEAGKATDPDPLNGDRFALWTWNNGIMVAQVRVSTDSDLTAVEPDAEPVSEPKTPYPAN